jgi:hypothetical protein
MSRDHGRRGPQNIDAISFAVIFAEHVEIPIHQRLQVAFLHARTVPVASG